MKALKAFRFTMALALIAAFLVVGCSDDDTTTNVYEAPPPDTPPLEGGTWLITSPSFVANNIVDFLVTFDTASLDVIRIQYRLEGTHYTYPDTLIVGAGSGSGGSVRVDAQWENSGTGVNSFQFNGTVISSGDEIVGRINFLIAEPGAGPIGTDDDAKMTRQSRQIDNGGGLIYDPVLDITWAQPSTGPSETYTWDDATAYVSGLQLGGVFGWRLPYASVAAGADPVFDTACDAGGSQAECADNELAYMFYINLGATSGEQVPPGGDQDVLDLFGGNIDPTVPFWTGTEDPNGDKWWFSFAGGRDGVASVSFGYFVWAVHDGNIKP
jgi:hypothetical protein